MNDLHSAGWRRGLTALAVTSEPRPPRLAGISILIVDDVPAAADALRELLRLEGADVDVALDGERALAMAAARRYDVVITDLSMPGMSGAELLPALRATAANRVAALLYSGYSVDAADVRRAGFDGRLVKPAPLDAFVDAIRSTLGRRVAA